MELWTKQHVMQLLPSLAVMFVIAAVLRLTIGKKDLKIRMIPFQILAVFIVLIEIGKQAYSLSKGYDLYHLPFHFCSLFIFMLPLMAFYRGKHRSVVTGITAAISGAMFLLMVIYPNLIYGAWNIEDYFKGYLDFHTVTFHNVVMLEFLLIVALDLHEPAPRGETKHAALFTTGFCVVSASMAHLLKTNFANYYSCNIPPLEAVRQSVENAWGRLPATLLYVATVSALNIVFVIGAYWFYRLCRRLISAKKENKVSAV